MTILGDIDQYDEMMKRKTAEDLGRIESIPNDEGQDGNNGDIDN